MATIKLNQKKSGEKEEWELRKKPAAGREIVYARSDAISKSIVLIDLLRNYGGVHRKKQNKTKQLYIC